MIRFAPNLKIKRSRKYFWRWEFVVILSRPVFVSDPSAAISNEKTFLKIFRNFETWISEFLENLEVIFGSNIQPHTIVSPVVKGYINPKYSAVLDLDMSWSIRFRTSRKSVVSVHSMQYSVLPRNIINPCSTPLWANEWWFN